MDTHKTASWLEIDLDIIKNNIKSIQNFTRKPVMAIVKANAYGHGLLEIAAAAKEAGCPWCGTARLEEALLLRKSGIQGGIFVLGYTQPEAVPLAAANQISLAVYDLETANLYHEQLEKNSLTLNVHLKLDTGMGRLGIFPENVLDFVKSLAKFRQINLEGVFTHFARADEPQLETTDSQLKRFSKAVKTLEEADLRPSYVHAANSAATLHYPEAYYDILRPGIILYGLPPSAEVNMLPELKPALTWKTRIASIKELPAGHGISYGHTYITKKTEKIGAIAAGYADGLRRTPGNIVLIHGKRVPLVGRVCMDQSMISLDSVPDAKVGDEVVILGKQGEDEISAQEIAARWGTINYEIVSGLAQRLSRFYKKSE